MKADLAARLRRTMRGEAIAETGVTGVSGVTGRTGLRLKPPQLRQLRPLRLERDDGRKSAKEGVTSPVTAPIAPDFDAIEERAALAADCVPACYLDAWARLQCQKPASVSEAEWRLALDDGGLFLDAWGNDAADMRWTPGELFDVTAGLVFRLAGAVVEALGPDHMRLDDGRTLNRNGRDDFHCPIGMHGDVAMNVRV
jgi:hypothetical protein